MKARSVMQRRPLSPDALAPDMLSRIEANLTRIYWSGRPRHRAATIVQISFAVRPFTAILLPISQTNATVPSSLRRPTDHFVIVHRYQGSSRDEGLLIWCAEWKEAEEYATSGPRRFVPV